MKKVISGATAVALAVAGVLIAAPLTAAATEQGTPPEVCVPSEAYTEVVPDIEHPAEYETVVITPGVEASTKWWNFAPNKDQGPLEGEPSFPEDERGTWEGPHTEGGPGQDQEGVYQQGEGNGSWFYRENTEAQEEVTEERLVKEAWTEVVPDIEHPAVVCEDEPDPAFVPCEATDYSHATDLSAWDFTQSSSDGSASWSLVEDGLAVSTLSEGHRKVAGYTAASFPLSHYGSFDINWTGTSPAPGGQLLVDLDNDGTPTGYLVIEDAYAGEWWLSANWGGDVDPADLPVSAVGGGGADWATPQEFLNAFPDAQVMAVGFSLGSGVTGNGIIHSITAGCTVYTFGLPDPEPVAVTLTAPVWVDQCGTENDDAELPANVDGIEYTWLSDDTESPDYWTVRAYVGEGYAVNDLPDGWASVGEGAYDYVIPMSSEACPVVEPEPTPTPTATPVPVKANTPTGLAATGGPDTSLFIGGGVLALLLGAAALVGARLRRR